MTPDMLKERIEFYVEQLGESLAAFDRAYDVVQKIAAQGVDPADAIELQVARVACGLLHNVQRLHQALAAGSTDDT